VALKTVIGPREKPPAIKLVSFVLRSTKAFDVFVQSLKAIV
jgi:hypothetical protein